MELSLIALVAVLVLAVVVLVVLVLLLRRAAKKTEFVDAEEPPADEEPAVDAPPDEESIAGLGSVFRRAKRLLRKSAEHDPYLIPLHLLAGSDRSRGVSLLERSGCDLPFGTAADTETALGAGRGFWFFDHGVVLDVAGPYILSADGRTSDESGWQAVLRHLQKLRPRRPLDGVIVTISCAALLDAAGDVGASELAERMLRLHRKLAAAQQRLGFRLPAYVVVTGCEALPGFASLCAALPPHARREMLGWSSPYNADLAYRGEWVGEAFDEVGNRLDGLQMEFFAEGVAEPELLLQLPAALRGLAVAARVALDQLFRSSAYHGQLIPRGIYFCGGDAFLADVLDRKVFAESGLATPTSRTIGARNRTVRALRLAVAALALFFAGGLGWAWYGFRRHNETLLPFLKRTRDSVIAVRNQEKPGHAPAPNLQRAAVDLLTDMAKIDFRTYGSVFVPSSWLSGVDDHLRDSVSAAFREVILRGLRVRLDEKANDIFDEADREPLLPASWGRGVDAAAVRVDQLPDFQRLQKFVASLKELEENGHTFNELCKKNGAGIKELGGVINYAFGTKLPDAIYSDAKLYEQALVSTTYRDTFAPSAFQSQASNTAEALAGKVYAGVFENNALLARTQELWRGLQDLAAQTPRPGDTERFREVAQQMRAVEVAAAQPGLEWAFKKDVDLGPAFMATLHDIKESAFLGNDTYRHIVEDGRNRLSNFHNALLTPAPLTGPVLAVRDGHPEMQLSPDALMLKSGLDTFLVQGFVSSAQRGRRLAVDLPPERRLVWDGALLEQAAAVAQAYDRFREKNLTRFPSDVRVAVDQVARERARGEMFDLLAMAQRFEPAPPASEEELRAQITLFAQAMPPLNDVLDGFTRLGYSEPRRDVAWAMTAEGGRLLRGVDHLLESDAPYRPRQGAFRWWDGKTPPSPAAWDAKDAAELAAYLDTSRTRVAQLARSYAQPLLTWLRKAGTSDRADVRASALGWQGIVDDLAEFDAKKPGNAVAALDDYFTTQLAKVKPGDCAAAALPSPLRANHDFFAKIAADVSRDVTKQCYALAGNDAGERYAELARFFNQRLAGRYPFSKAPKKDVPEAEVGDIRTFFKLFDARQAAIASMPENGPLGPARKWIEEMAKVRVFFAPFLDAQKGDAEPAYDVEPSFRLLRKHEVDGDQVIGWSLTIGDTTITNRDKTKKLRWTPGKEVELALRWASNAPRVPSAAKPQPAMSVHDRTAAFDYTNRWSLLAALDGHRVRAEELPAYADVEPVTLVLTVPTETAADGKPSPVPARLFVRLALLAPGTTQPVELPQFPGPPPKVEEAAR